MTRIWYDTIAELDAEPTARPVDDGAAPRPSAAARAWRRLRTALARGR